MADPCPRDESRPKSACTSNRDIDVDALISRLRAHIETGRRHNRQRLVIDLARAIHVIEWLRKRCSYD
jgi:hypothetical protein